MGENETVGRAVESATESAMEALLPKAVELIAATTDLIKAKAGYWNAMTANVERETLRKG